MSMQNANHQDIYSYLVNDLIKGDAKKLYSKFKIFWMTQSIFIHILR